MRWLMYEYRIYGLKVSSELIIEEAYRDTVGTCPDVKISYCYVEEEELHQKAHQLKYSFKLFNFYIKNVGIYRVKEGKEIIIEITREAKIEDITCYLLGTAFGFLLIQREIVAVHGSCISSSNFGVIISGDSGAGKSTISTKLFQKGYDFIADDVCALNIQSEDILVQLAYPQQKLCRDAVTSQGYDLESLIYLDEERDKFAIRLHNTNRFRLEARLGVIVILNCSSEISEVEVRLLSSHEKLDFFLHSIFRYELLQTLGIPHSFMKKIIEIVNRTPIYNLTRPEGLNTQEEVTDYIIEVIEKNRQIEYLM